MKLSVKVKAGARTEKIDPSVSKDSGMAKGVYKISVKERAGDGRANEAVMRVLSEHFHVARNRITIKSGKTSKNKIIEIK